ncbi:transcription factor [Fusarium denticulatum]|uniref:Transcription factor n=1 Tax=Fusarium denticulatum TaxID=48507 RepID=A0A8H5TG02_9HYPO|nr:transcription factor [Fusarium denticulatum]
MAAPRTTLACIKRNIGHLCHDDPREDDSKNRKTIQTAQTLQTNTMSIVNSNLESYHYTISRDHTGGAEDRKSKILADFGKKHIKAWTKISLANINSPTADPDTSAEGLKSLGGPDTRIFKDGSSTYVSTPKDIYQVLSETRRSPIAAPTQSESFPPLTPLQALSTFTPSLLPLRTTKTRHSADERSRFKAEIR